VWSHPLQLSLLPSLLPSLLLPHGYLQQQLLLHSR
jgi:hypothetical protein